MIIRFFFKDISLTLVNLKEMRNGTPIYESMTNNKDRHYKICFYAFIRIPVKGDLNIKLYAKRIDLEKFTWSYNKT